MKERQMRLESQEGENREVVARAVDSVLKGTDQQRERDVARKRGGLKIDRATLDEVGKELGVTRERVRQIEKSVFVRLKLYAESGKAEMLPAAEKIILRELTQTRILRVEELAEKLFGSNANRKDVSALVLVARVSTKLTLIDNSDKYFASIAIAEFGTAREWAAQIDAAVAAVAANKKPLTLTELDKQLDYQHPDHLLAVLESSRLLAEFNDLWGLAKWPEVNPRNIRDKIFAVLSQIGEPTHFSKIAEQINADNFGKKSATPQAIHNELIRDNRFVLVGRGIYALADWGFNKGTVADVIKQVLTDNGGQMTRDEILEAVLRVRQVKTTTVTLALQNRDDFTKLDKNTYELAK
ncbi:MAG: hypothetical protein LBM12_01365 [Candidatus Nomurabacteria bacterium]|jgi:hypothetical protein|nr:hypothetical protein [Candidatus Nomurabacteria bacterium]